MLYNRDEIHFFKPPFRHYINSTGLASQLSRMNFNEIIIDFFCILISIFGNIDCSP